MPAADHTAVFLPEPRMPLPPPPLPAPPTGQPSLLRALCVWSAIISTLQLAFLIFFFIKEGHHMPPPTEVPPTPLMLRLTADKVSADGVISWKNLEESALVEVSDGGRALTILEDGNYFLSLWLTLEGCRNNSVSLDHKSNALLRAEVRPPACTAWRGNISRLSASREETLRLTLSPPASGAILKDHTRLDIFFVPMAP